MHAEGQRFESVILHEKEEAARWNQEDLGHVGQPKRIETEEQAEEISNPTRSVEVVKEEESKQGQTVDALALGGEEGRDKLRKAVGRCK